MRNLILFFIKYGGFFLFVFFEFICFYLVINYNQKQQDIFINSSNLFAGYFTQKKAQLNNYFLLEEDNESLRLENAQLLQSLINSDTKNLKYKQDSIKDRYTIIPSTICSKTLNLRNNYLTLCDGKNKGFHIGMGVIDQNGIVGIIQTSTEHFSKVISVLNGSSRISVAIKNKLHHGTLLWDTYDSRYATIHNIRKHAKISIGDTIVTSGYSMVFPAGIELGTIKKFDLIPGRDSYEILINLKSNFEKVSNVFVINHLYKKEFEEIKEEDD